MTDIACRLELYTYKRNEVIFEEEEFGDQFYIILTGIIILVL